jgi:16S rRNA (guanine(966)-N(2))-methyltransferase RsmD
MAVRISSGKLKGRKVKVCSLGEDLRPTSSKVREALFDILGPWIKGSVFVDLYAGTGAVGMEAMSREADTVYFIEANRKRASQIKDTLEGCGCRPKAFIVNMKAGKFIERSAKEGKKFDIVFLDPPYASGEVESLLEELGQGEALSEDALVVAEHPSKSEMPEASGVLRKKKTYRYGDTKLTVMERKNG